MSGSSIRALCSVLSSVLPLLFSSAFAPLQETAEPGRQDRALLAAIAEGYLHNREAIPFGKGRFTVLNGKTSSMDAALAGEFEDAVLGEGLWVFD